MVAGCWFGHYDFGVGGAVEVVRLAAVERELAEVDEARGAELAGDVSVGGFGGGESVADEVGGEVVGGPDAADEFGEPHGHVDVVVEV